MTISYRTCLIAHRGLGRATGCACLCTCVSVHTCAVYAAAKEGEGSRVGTVKLCDLYSMSHAHLI